MHKTHTQHTSNDRVVGAYLSQLDPSAFADPTYVKGTLIKQPTQLFELSRLSARQLSFVKSESNQLGEQVGHMHTYAHLAANCTQTHKFTHTHTHTHIHTHTHTHIHTQRERHTHTHTHTHTHVPTHNTHRW
jgi:hypothetical protein